MKLALETSNKAASMVIGVDRVEARLQLSPSQMQSRDLVPLLMDILAQNNIAASEVSDIAVNVGPGSTTGLRMGVAVVQAFCMVYPQVLVHGVPLEALALAQLGDSSAVKSDKAHLMVNAFGGTVFVHSYNLSSNGWLECGELRVLPVSDLEQLEGDALIIHDLGELRNNIKPAQGWEWSDRLFPDASLVFSAMHGGKHRTTIERLDVRYIKPSSAEINWKKK